MSYGEQLRVARLESGLALSDVAARSRIRERVLQDLESERLHSSGGAAYARGHLRTLGRIYGMNVEELISSFDATQSAIEISMSALLEENNVTTKVERDRPSWKIFGAVAALVAFAMLSFQFIPGIVTGDSDAHSLSKVANNVLGNEKESGPVASAVKGVTLMLTANDQVSWVKVAGASGETVFEGKIGNGQSQSFFDDQQLSLIIGNAGAISITFNGENLGAAGATGEVVRLAFTPDSHSAG